MGRSEDQFQLLRESTGRLFSSAASGTGFFVGPNLVLTCAHVVAPALAASVPLEFHWRGDTVSATVKQIFPATPNAGGATYPYPDLAVVSVKLHGPALPLLEAEPTPGAKMYAYGYTDEYPEGDSALFDYEGPTNADDELLYRLKASQARPGLSGAPLLDVARGGIVAIVKRTRDKETDLGSRAVPMTTVRMQIPELFAAGSAAAEAATVDRSLDVQTRTLQAYEEELARLGAPEQAAELEQQVEATRQTIGELRAKLDAVASPPARPSAAGTADLPPRDEFVGRANEVTQLKKALASRSPIVAVDGIGGVGKTALALEFAHDVSAAGFEGVVWASTVQRPVALAELVDTAARILDYPAVTRLPEQEKSAALRSVLAGHRYLIVLDGFEAVDDPGVDAFLRSVPEANKTLLTSRRTVADVRALSLQGLSRDEALDLMRKEAERLGLDGIDDVAGDLGTLYDLTGGSPAALKYALGLLRQGYDLPDVIDDLRHAEGEIFDVIIGRTWEKLSESARTVLMVMPCFGAPAPRARMQSAANLADDEFDAAVETLTQGRLLEQQGSIGKRGFTVPPLLRAFANSVLLKQPDLETAARKRLAADYLTLINENKSRYAEGFDRIEAELANVLDTIEWCHARNEWQPLIDLVDGLAEFLWVRGYWSERIKRATQGLDAARALGDGVAGGRFAYFIGWVHSRWNNTAEARRWADEAQKLMASTYGDQNPYASQLRGLAAFRRAKAAAPATQEEAASFQEAETLLKQALTLFENDTRLPNACYLVTTVKDNLGELYHDWGHADEARSFFEAVLADAEANDWDERLATANGDLGDLAYAEGDIARAKQLYETGLAHALRIKRANTIALCSLGLGRTLRQQGDIEAAYDHLREALDIYRRLDASSVVGTIEAELSELAAELAASGKAQP